MKRAPSIEAKVNPDKCGDKVNHRRSSGDWRIGSRLEAEDYAIDRAVGEAHYRDTVKPGMAIVKHMKVNSHANRLIHCTYKYFRRQFLPEFLNNWANQIRPLRLIALDTCG